MFLLGKKTLMLAFARVAGLVGGGGPSSWLVGVALTVVSRLLSSPVLRTLPPAPAAALRAPGGPLHRPDGVVHRPVHPPRLPAGDLATRQVSPAPSAVSSMFHLSNDGRGHVTSATSVYLFQVKVTGVSSLSSDWSIPGVSATSLTFVVFFFFTRLAAPPEVHHPAGVGVVSDDPSGRVQNSRTEARVFSV